MSNEVVVKELTQEYIFIHIIYFSNAKYKPHVFFRKRIRSVYLRDAIQYEIFNQRVLRSLMGVFHAPHSLAGFHAEV